MPDTIEYNKDMARRVFDELWNRGNLDEVGALFAEDYRGHDPADVTFGSGRGAGAVRDFIRMIRSASNDLHFDITEIVSDNDITMVMWVGTGTHTSEFLGIEPTGIRVETSGVVIYRIINGKIVEGWHCWDSTEIFRQLGVKPPQPDQQ